MTDARIDELMGTLQRFFNPREEGWVWVATDDDDDLDRGVLSQIEGAYDEPLVAARGLARMIDVSGAAQAHVMICRWDGRPTEDDRVLWRELDRLVSPDKLLDMLAFNDSQRWSMRADNIAA